MQHTGFTGSILRKLPGTASKVWLIALALLLCLSLIHISEPTRH